MKWLPDPSTALAPHALALAREAVKRRPEAPGGWLALAAMLGGDGTSAEAREVLREATARLAPSATLFAALARAEHEAGDTAAALAATARALALEPDDRIATILRFRLLLEARQREPAGALADAVESADPTNPLLLAYRYAKTETVEDKRRFAAACAALLEQYPFCTAAAHLRALALAEVSEREAAAAAIGLGDVEINALPAPEGFDTEEAFRSVLAEEILANPTLVPDPRGKATCRGRQTARLRQPGASAVESLLGHIRLEVAAYAERRVSGGGGAPDRVDLKAWAVVCEAEGRQSSHYHPGGWLSGVYYVTAPPAPDGAHHLGALLLGAVGAAKGGAPWPVREVEPRPGRLVIFPSQLPHATRASGAAGPRISVAFDVVPA